jgi:ubiquinol-cytochrome c reductase cytochrome b subunit
VSSSLAWSSPSCWPGRPRDRPKRTAFGAAFFALLFTLFGASSTDVLANFFHVSLNATLWFFRIATFVVPVVVYAVTWLVCREMQMVPGIGRRKRAVVVERSEEGEYTAIPSEVRPGDEHVELEPVPVPVMIEVEPEPEPAGASAGTRRGGRGVRRVRR